MVKILNRTNTRLVLTFKTEGGGIGCGFINPGNTLTRDFSTPATVLISTEKPIEYNDVTTETIEVSSCISEKPEKE